jgi:hypothetical protein
VAQLLFHKPNDPKEFIVEYLEKAKRREAMPLLNRVDLEAMFGMFDVTKRGNVTTEQANNAVKTMLGPAADLSNSGIYVSSHRLLNKEEFVKTVYSVIEKATPAKAI